MVHVQTLNWYLQRFRERIQGEMDEDERVVINFIGAVERSVHIPDKPKREKKSKGKRKRYTRNFNQQKAQIAYLLKEGKFSHYVPIEFTLCLE